MGARRKSQKIAEQIVAVLDPKPAVSPLVAMVDELGALDSELAPLAPKISRAENLRKAIRAHFDQAPADQEQTAAGTKYDVLLGEKENASTVDVVKVAQIIGVQQTLAIASCTLKALKAFPSALVFAVSYARTGTRPLTIRQKGAAA